VQRHRTPCTCGRAHSVGIFSRTCLKHHLHLYAEFMSPALLAESQSGLLTAILEGCLASHQIANAY
jgi:hypothetical protein